jgi:hypothetical protein
MLRSFSSGLVSMYRASPALADAIIPALDQGIGECGLAVVDCKKQPGVIIGLKVSNDPNYCMRNHTHFLCLLAYPHWHQSQILVYMFNVLSNWTKKPTTNLR